MLKQLCNKISKQRDHKKEDIRVFPILLIICTFYTLHGICVKNYYP